MESIRALEVATPIHRRAAIGLGVASGLALASFPTAEAFGKAPTGNEEKDPHLAAAWFFAIKRDVRYSTNGHYAVLYPENTFAGDPVRSRHARHCRRRSFVETLSGQQAATAVLNGIGPLSGATANWLAVRIMHYPC
jgi:hypothetical protein